MSAWVPGTLPPQLDLGGLVFNPQGNVPGPFPRDINSQIYVGASQTLTFVTAGLPTGVYARAQWLSPVFNLRPYFRSLLPNASVGDTGVQGTVDIWLPAGATGKLWVHATNLHAINWSTAGLRVSSEEYASLTNPTILSAITTPQDITTEFLGGAASAMACFLAPGMGYPVAFYQLKLTFDYIQDNTAEPGWPYPKIQLQSAYY